ncbi:MAG: orotidine-5'-phosphate decarboxylase [Actinomycetota bacterium]|nr:orotidine-5'-phosphate decarboxylase [Actinomycetota bacterium]
MTAPHDLGREHLALALDVDDLVVAVRSARRMRPWFAVAKVGLELFTAAGPDAISVMVDEGYRVFLDVKLHDIPTTVGRAARVAGGLGVTYLTVHTSGGRAMVRAAVEGLAEGAGQAAGPVGPGPRADPPPAVLGVTVLTSDARSSASDLDERLAIAQEAGCGGVVCPVGGVGALKARWPQMQAVVPGIRPAGAGHDDQVHVATPAAACAAGADLLVIGRAVTRAGDPEAVASAIARDVGEACAARHGESALLPGGRPPGSAGDLG